MLELIGENVRRALEKVDYIRLAGGYAEPITKDDNGTLRTFPACRVWPGIVHSEDYVNLSPHEDAGCIAFVDAGQDVEVLKATERAKEISTYFRVVVWYDQRRILADNQTALQIAMANDLIVRLRNADFTGGGIVAGRAEIYGTSNNVDAIWGRYGMGVDDRGLFMAPYNTFSMLFKFTGRWLPDCYCPNLIPTDSKC